ncbi:MAG: hypothetical protein ACOVLC_07530 [Flavobacterium sp.]
MNLQNKSIEMKINETQTERLYRFTREHFVEYYDLQTELVDHLAQGIEAQWKENPELDFEDALQKEFKKFGIFGFSDVISERQAAMSKRYNTFIWHHFKEYFGIPKIILTISAIFGLFGLISLVDQHRELIFIGLLVVYAFFYFFFYRKRMKKNKPTKKWMMAEMIYSFGAGTSMMPFYFQVPAQMMIHAPQVLYNSYFLFFYCLVMVLFLIINHIMIYVIPQKAEVYLMETYPEYKLEHALSS